MRGVLVTGTDTGVGKSILSGALIAAMVAAGEQVRAHKPVVTGLEEGRAAALWPADHELLGMLAGMAPEEVSPVRLQPALSPHLAARLAGLPIEPQALVAAARKTGGEGTTVVVEGVGGLLVPLCEDFTVRDLAVALGLPVVIASRPGLGTINHTLLSVEAARAAGLDVRAVVLTPWPAEPGTMERSNRETIERLGAVATATLAPVAGPDPVAFAAAAAGLPWRDWIGGAEDRGR